MFVRWIPKNSKNDWRFRWDFLLVHDSGPNLGTVHVTRHILKRQGVWWFDGCQEFGFSMFQQTFSHRNSCWLLPPCSSPQTPVRYDDAIFHLAEARSLYVRGLPDLDIWRVRYHTNSSVAFLLLSMANWRRYQGTEHRVWNRYLDWFRFI